jgi:hypothetical protein
MLRAYKEELEAIQREVAEELGEVEREIEELARHRTDEPTKEGTGV